MDKFQLRRPTGERKIGERGLDGGSVKTRDGLGPMMYQARRGNGCRRTEQESWSCRIKTGMGRDQVEARELRGCK